VIRQTGNPDRQGPMRSSRESARAPRVSAERVAELARHVTERDREIALRLYEQQLLATDQLTLLFFSSKRRALDRLLLLYHQRVLDRFYPPWRFGAGKPQAHWLLDEGGAQLVAAMLGVERKRLGWQRRDDWGSHRQLAPVAPRGGAVHRWRSTASSPISSPSRSPTRR
jgi:protein involved in plasmid replication-relaxation